MVQPLTLTPLWRVILSDGLSFAAFWFASARLSDRIELFAAISRDILGLFPGKRPCWRADVAAFAMRSPVGRGALLGHVLTLKPQLV